VLQVVYFVTYCHVQGQTFGFWHPSPRSTGTLHSSTVVILFHLPSIMCTGHAAAPATRTEQTLLGRFGSTDVISGGRAVHCRLPTFRSGRTVSRTLKERRWQKQATFSSTCREFGFLHNRRPPPAYVTSYAIDYAILPMSASAIYLKLIYVVFHYTGIMARPCSLQMPADPSCVLALLASLSVVISCASIA